MTTLYNLTALKGRRRNLRRNSPSPETLVWNMVRNRQIEGYKFRRQYSIGRFVVDFFCPEMKLAIEIDGDTHYQPGRPDKDAARQKYLSGLGISFLRLTNLDVTTNLEGVREKIVKSTTSPNLSLARRGTNLT